MPSKTEKKRLRKELEEQKQDASGALSAKKRASQGSRTSSSSPTSEEAASASPQPSAVVVKNTPPAAQRTIKKIFGFEYGYPKEGESYRPDDEFSDDDDDFAIASKKQEMSRIHGLYEKYHEQLSHPQKVTEGEDCPFFSLSNLANHSRLFFGPFEDMNEDVWQETARRILIVREFILSNDQKSVNTSFLEESDTRSSEIPRGCWTTQEITESGWTLGEYRTVLRRLTRTLAKWAFVDDFDRAQISINRDDRDMPRQMTLDDFNMDFGAVQEEDYLAEADDGLESDDEDFVADVDRFVGVRKPIFDRCFAFIQKGMPVTMSDIFELVQESKRQKVELRSAQEELDQTQQTLKEAEQNFASKEMEGAGATTKAIENESLRNRSFIEQSVVQREHEASMLAGQLKLEELKFRNKQLEMEHSKSLSGAGVGVSLSGAGTPFQMVQMTNEEALVVRGAKEWKQWVKLMVEIKEWPARWPSERIQRQFTEKVRREVIASLQNIRSTKPLPARLIGFDSETDGKYHFFTPPQLPGTFADTIEAYLRANDRDKEGKLIPVSVGRTVTTDSFARYLESGHTKKKFGFDISDTTSSKCVDALLEFATMADRFCLPAGQAVWGEALQKWVRVAADPPLSLSVLAQDKEHIRLWFKACEAAYLKETGKDGLHFWLKAISTDVKDLIISEGWETLRDVVKLMYSFHSSKAKKYEDFRRTDPRNQVEVPLASEKELAAALSNGKTKGGNPRSPPKRPREP